jgi:hypothetical protein
MGFPGEPPRHQQNLPPHAPGPGQDPSAGRDPAHAQDPRTARLPAYGHGPGLAGGSEPGQEPGFGRSASQGSGFAQGPGHGQGDGSTQGPGFGQGPSPGFGQGAGPYEGPFTPRRGRQTTPPYGRSGGPGLTDPEQTDLGRTMPAGSGWANDPAGGRTAEQAGGPAGGHRPGPDHKTEAETETSPGGPPPRSNMWSPYDEGPRSRRPLYLALGALGVLIAAGVGLANLASSEDAAPVGAADTTPAPVAGPPPVSPGGKYGFAASRKTDPHPLSVAEVFPRKKVTKSGRQYLMTTRRADKTCKNAVEGSKIEKALREGGCNQIIRASFRDRSGKIIGTVGVANLKTVKAAAKVITVGGGGERQDYVKPLPGKDSITKFLGAGEASAGGWQHGHYAILLWFQYKDGHLPSKAETRKLTQAALDITDATVFPALDSRALTGRRAR